MWLSNLLVNVPDCRPFIALTKVPVSWSSSSLCCDSGQPPRLFLPPGLLEDEPISPVVACVMEKQRGVCGVAATCWKSRWRGSLGVGLQ